MSDNTAQVRITNTTTSVDGVLVPTILSIKASAMLNYVLSIRNECNKLYIPNRWKEFDHLPLLSVWDLADTKEEFLFDEHNLPKKTVLNSKGIPILIILPEVAKQDMGLNKFDVLSKNTRDKLMKQLREKSSTSSTLRSEIVKPKNNG